MNLKLECACGMKYEFAIEPVDGRMPYAISCPNCGVDSTEQVNQMLGAGTTDVVEVFDVEGDVEDYEIETPADVVEEAAPPAPAETTPEAPKRSGLTLPSTRSDEAPAPADLTADATPEAAKRSGLTLPSMRNSEPSPAPADATPEAPKRSGLSLPTMRNSEPSAPGAAPSASDAAAAPSSSGKSPLKIGGQAREEAPAEAPAEKPEVENLAAANEAARQQSMARIKAKQEAEKKQ